jgi:hypothetical protein
MTLPPGAPALVAAPPAPAPPAPAAAPGPTWHAPSIWWWAFGYFACYVPYSALTKLLSSSQLASGGPVRSLELLAPSALASVATMLTFLLATGWWRHAGRRRILGRAVPFPGRLPLLSGLCSAGIIATTTLAYTFSGVSLVLVALLMRGGVLVLAPIVDRLTRRRVRVTSWIALGLSLASLLVAMTSSWHDTRMPLVAAVDLACYLGCYFVRLTLMSRQAKADHATNLRYFVEEGLVSAPALLVAVALGALVLGGELGRQLAAGFTTFFDRPLWWLGLLVGVTSQGTGIFGGLVFLDPRETSFCVPVNRASSVLAVLVASLLLVVTFDAAAPSGAEWAGAALLLVALGLLAFPGRRPAG